jgi:hypothetical protein
MQTFAIALSAALAQGALACECDRAGTWVSPHGAVFVFAPAETRDEPEQVGTSRETFITRVGQDDRGYWTMTREDMDGTRIDDRHAIASAPFPGTGELASSSEAP